MTQDNSKKATWNMAASATLHCLTGCAIGEIAGMVIGTWLGLEAHMTIILAVILAFLSGYALSTRPLLRRGMSFVPALRVVFWADTLSILTMEIVDNLIMYYVPGAMEAGPTSLLFWTSMILALAVAFVITWPVNYWQISRGKGHALTHAHHSDPQHHH